MDVSIEDIRTPPRRKSMFASLLLGRLLLDRAARLGIRLARRHGKPFRLGKRVIAVRYRDVRAIFERDLDFLIAPVNEVRIKEVNGGPFILGMDRSEQLVRERGALYCALAELDLDNLGDYIRDNAEGQLETAGQRFDALRDYASPVATATAVRIFGIGSSDDMLFKEAVRAIFAHTFLNLGSDEMVRIRALKAGELMRVWFAEEIARRRANGDLGDDLMGQLLRQNKLDDDGVRRTLGGMLVGSIDTTTTAFAQIVCVVDSDQALARRVLKRWQDGDEIYGYCLEALRRWPHNPIVLREARGSTILGGTKVTAGDSVIAWTQAAMLDPAAFPEPRQMLPDRAPHSYLHFGAGLHPCAGRSVNRLQLPILLGRLLETGARRDGTLEYAGPFPTKLPVALPPVSRP